VSDYGQASLWSLRRWRGHGMTSTKSRGTLSLPGDHEVPFRLVGPEDASALQRFLGRCSERTIYLRFFGSLGEFSEEKARYFASVDGVDHFGLVALDPDHRDEIIAIVRYDREPGDERAEYAALVEDRWQGLGIGTALTQRLIEAARDKGVRCFYALVKGENRRMLNVLRHLDLPEREVREGSVKSVEVGLNYQETLRPRRE
jgi:GNAT superfamily N-acetyltransferase